MSLFLQLLDERTRRNKRLSAIGAVITERTEARLLHKKLFVWQRTLIKTQMLRDVQPYLVKQRADRLMTRALKALYNHRSFRIVKKAMRRQAEAYDAATKTKRVFGVLQEYTSYRRDHNERSDRARAFHRYIVFRRWLWLTRRKVANQRRPVEMSESLWS